MSLPFRTKEKMSLCPHSSEPPDGISFWSGYARGRAGFEPFLLRDRRERNVTFIKAVFRSVNGNLRRYRFPFQDRGTGLLLSPLRAPSLHTVRSWDRPGSILSGMRDRKMYIFGFLPFGFRFGSLSRVRDEWQACSHSSSRVTARATGLYIRPFPALWG